jgi:hypothetical protein
MAGTVSSAASCWSKPQPGLIGSTPRMQPYAGPRLICPKLKSVLREAAHGRCRPTLWYRERYAHGSGLRPYREPPSAQTAADRETPRPHCSAFQQGGEAWSRSR